MCLWRWSCGSKLASFDPRGRFASDKPPAAASHDGCALVDEADAAESSRGAREHSAFHSKRV